MRRSHGRLRHDAFAGKLVDRRDNEARACHPAVERVLVVSRDVTNPDPIAQAFSNCEGAALGRLYSRGKVSRSIRLKQSTSCSERAKRHRRSVAGSSARSTLRVGASQQTSHAVTAGSMSADVRTMRLRAPRYIADRHYVTVSIRCARCGGEVHSTVRVTMELFTRRGLPPRFEKNRNFERLGSGGGYRIISGHM